MTELDYVKEVRTDYVLIVKLIAETSDEARPTLLRLLKRLIDGLEQHGNYEVHSYCFPDGTKISNL